MKRVGILRGGDEEHYDASLLHGAHLISHIFEHLKDKFKVFDILVDKDGVWHISGVPIIPSQLQHKVDVVWNTSHPSLNNVLENFSIPVVGNSHFSSMVAKNRTMLEEHMNSLGVEMPRHLVLPLYQPDFDGSVDEYIHKKVKEVFNKFSPPWIVRSLAPDPTMGVHVANTMSDLARAIEDGVNHGQGILVEEFIIGKVAALHSVAGFRGEDVYVFPPTGLLASVKDRFIALTKNLHRQLGNHPYLKSNFVMNPKGKIFLTGILFTPNFKENSHFCQSCESVGAKPHHVIEHILRQAML